MLCSHYYAVEPFQPRIPVAPLKSQVMNPFTFRKATHLQAGPLSKLFLNATKAQSISVVNRTRKAAPTEARSARCPEQKPIHCLLTAQATVYQQWQARIMYYHWTKQARLDGPCSDMTGFTRLVASEDGKPDGLETEMPSVFVRQLTTDELATLGHFGVLNRPYSVIQYIAAGYLSRIAEDFVYIAEVAGRASHQ